jgi:hypothetical protein
MLSRRVFHRSRILAKKLSTGIQSIVTTDKYAYYGYGYDSFGKILTGKSYLMSEKTDSSTGDKYLSIRDEFDNVVISGLVNSNLFYGFYVNANVGHNFTKIVIESIPFNYPDEATKHRLSILTATLMQDLACKSKFDVAYGRSNHELSFICNQFCVDESHKVVFAHNT